MHLIIILESFFNPSDTWNRKYYKHFLKSQSNEFLMYHWLKKIKTTKITSYEKI